MRTDKDFISALLDAKLVVRFGPTLQKALEVTGVTYNSKEASLGTLFVCKGAHFKEQYLQDAIDAGASCYVTETSYGLSSENCTEIVVSDIRRAMPIIAETFYGKLSDDLSLIGITGTKGKSTTTYFMRYILDDYMAATGGQRSA
ncbi:MAG: UDP-N-acetylmuramoyl-L-alanyl-D-glutamate--2,6-diaminopimelate ligase, partial [Bacillota bacterium]|nr:UDP-N-acetylmuramoyl-L-alanyl-D-glutamate--2,6-diaminopimelate ligase [Bacillota bacterium]